MKIKRWQALLVLCLISMLTLVACASVADPRLQAGMTYFDNSGLKIPRGGQVLTLTENLIQNGSRVLQDEITGVLTIRLIMDDSSSRIVYAKAPVVVTTTKAATSSLKAANVVTTTSTISQSAPSGLGIGEFLASVPKSLSETDVFQNGDLRGPKTLVGIVPLLILFFWIIPRHRSLHEELVTVYEEFRLVFTAEHIASITNTEFRLKNVTVVFTLDFSGDGPLRFKKLQGKTKAEKLEDAKSQLAASIQTRYAKIASNIETDVMNYELRRAKVLGLGYRRPNIGIVVIDVDYGGIDFPPDVEKALFENALKLEKAKSLGAAAKNLAIALDISKEDAGKMLQYGDYITAISRMPKVHAAQQGGANAQQPTVSANAAAAATNPTATAP